jgi:hypothetical protein
MRETDKLCDIARQRLKELRAEGCEPTDDEIVELNAIGWKRQSPRYRQALSRGYPVECGGIVLWPLTMQAASWYKRIGCVLPCAKYALAYAMANQYDTAITLPESRKDAERIVTSWASRLRVTVDGLMQAIDAVLTQDEDHDLPPPAPGDEAIGMTEGDLSAWLSAYGGTPELWERQVAESYARDWLRIKLATLNETGENMESSPEFRAALQFGWLCEKIRRRTHGI